MPKGILAAAALVLGLLCCVLLIRTAASPAPEPTQPTPIQTTEPALMETSPATVPETLPVIAPETVPETTAGTVPETTVETIPETVAETVPQTRPHPQPNPNYRLTARNAFVYDCTEDTLRFSKGNMDAQIAPASLTKLLTAYVALQYLEPETVITCTAETTWTVPAASVAGLRPGDQVTVDVLIQGMMLQSGNDAAQALAVAAGRVIRPGCGPKEALSVFMDTLNSTAPELGLTGTHFETPDGMDTWKHYTTPRDMLTIGLLVMEHPLLRHYTSLPQSTVVFGDGTVHTYENSNLLLQPDSRFYSPDACGMKTGTTIKAGSCLMALFHNGRGYVLVGVFGCPEKDARYRDVLQLYAMYGAPAE